MEKFQSQKVLILLGGIFLVVLALIISRSWGEEPVKMPEQSNFVKASQMGDYLDYRPGLVKKTKGDKVLLFHAAWCIQCQELETEIQAFGVPKGATIFKVDFDSSQDLRRQYGVTVQNTLVKIDNKGRPLGRYVVSGEPSFQAVVDALLR